MNDDVALLALSAAEEAQASGVEAERIAVAATVQAIEAKAEADAAKAQAGAAIADSLAAKGLAAEARDVAGQAAQAGAGATLAVASAVADASTAKTQADAAAADAVAAKTSAADAVAIAVAARLAAAAAVTRLQTPGPRGQRGKVGPAGVGKAGLGITWRGPWSALDRYIAQDAVEHHGSSYVATAPSMDAEPPSGPWDLMAAKGEDAKPGKNGPGQVIGGVTVLGNGGASGSGIDDIVVDRDTLEIVFDVDAFQLVSG